jgi:hypothetical protein
MYLEDLRRLASAEPDMAEEGDLINVYKYYSIAEVIRTVQMFQARCSSVQRVMIATVAVPITAPVTVPAP